MRLHPAVFVRKFQFVAQFNGCCGAAAPMAPPEEELSAKLTEVECGQ
jgi:uncharacterized protein (DUF779 family)